MDCNLLCMAWDWLGPASTAVVGIVGIGATAVLSLSQRRHDLRRTRSENDLLVAAEWRRQRLEVFREFLHHAEEMRLIAIYVDGHGRETFEPLRDKWANLTLDANKSMTSLVLIANANTYGAALKYLAAIRSWVEDGATDTDVLFLQRQLIIKMRIEVNPLLNEAEANISQMLNDLRFEDSASLRAAMKSADDGPSAH